MMYANSNSNSAHNNGYHHPQNQPSERRPGMSHRDRVRRGSRGGSRSRDAHDGGGVRVSDQRNLQQQQQQQQRPPCTDFDMAYFHSYAHVGIHEEMIKVCPFLILELQFVFFFLKNYFWVFLIVVFGPNLLNWSWRKFNVSSLDFYNLVLSAIKF